MGGNNVEHEQNNDKSKLRIDTMDSCNRDEALCDESYSDEDGEDPSYIYSYSLRRRR